MYIILDVLVNDGKMTKTRRRLKRNSLQIVLVSDGKVTRARRRLKRNSVPGVQESDGNPCGERKG